MLYPMDTLPFSMYLGWTVYLKCLYLTVCDYDEDEFEHQRKINVKIIHIFYTKYNFNILDRNTLNINRVSMFKNTQPKNVNNG